MKRNTRKGVRELKNTNMKNFIELKIDRISRKCELIEDISTKTFLTQKLKVLKSNYLDKNFNNCLLMLKTMNYEIQKI